MRRHHRARGLLIACTAAAGTCGGLSAAPNQPAWAYTWRTDLGFFDAGPTCLLDPPDGIDPSGLAMNFYWNAHDGVVMWLKGRLDEAPSIHLEFEGSADSWKVAVAPQKPHYDGRYALLEANVAAGILRNLELGHALTIVVSFDNGASLRYRVPASGAQIGVPMYRACVKSVTENPPRYLLDPGRPFLGSYMASERCEFGQIIQLHHIPLFVALSEDAHGGRMSFQRALESEGFEGPHWTRKTPDRIEAQTLFGQSFNLVEEYRYEISLDQLNDLAADLSRGATRKFGLTTPQGEQSTLKFGGPLGMPFAAMFAACRQAKLPTKELGAQ